LTLDGKANQWEGIQTDRTRNESMLRSSGRLFQNMNKIREVSSSWSHCVIIKDDDEIMHHSVCGMFVGVFVCSFVFVFQNMNKIRSFE
jgi:hypothetical protein